MTDLAHAPSSATPADGGEFNLLDVLIVFARNKRLIFGLPVLVGILAYIATSQLSPVYTGRAVILPPQQQQATSAMLGQLAALTGAGPSKTAGGGDLYIDMLKSNALVDPVVKRYKLQEVYELATPTAARKKLIANTLITVQPSGVIFIEFTNENPKLAADVSNAYVDELRRLNQVIAITTASQSRLFYEKQLQKAKNDLTTAELAMKELQEKTGMIQLETQGQAAINAAATLRAQIAGKEVELTAMRTFATEQNPAYIQKQQELAGLRAQLAKVDKDSGTLFVAGSKVPELGLEYARRLRDVKYYQAVFEILAKQYETARVEEARDTSIIQVLDPALPPEVPSGPKRMLIALISMVLTGFLTVLWVGLRAAEENARRDPMQAERIDILKGYLKFRK